MPTSSPDRRVALTIEEHAPGHWRWAHAFFSDPATFGHFGLVDIAHPTHAAALHAGEAAMRQLDNDLARP